MALSPYRLRLDVYSHGFRVSRFDDAIYRLCVEFCRRYVEHTLVMAGFGHYRRQQQQISKVYGAAFADRRSYFFHVGQLEAFLKLLHDHYIDAPVIERIDHTLYIPGTIKLEWKDTTREPRDYQKAIVEFFHHPLPIIKVLTAQAGSGKSVSLLLTMFDLKVRTILIMRPQYQKQWLKEAVKVFGLKPGEIVVVNGNKAMKDLIAYKDDPQALAKLKIIIVSNRTYQMYLQSYFGSSGKDTDGYGCPPHELCERLDIGLQVIDEVHLDFHLNYLITTMTHVPKSVALSATLTGDNPTRNQIVNLMFPQASFAPTPKYNAYIRLYGIGYRIRENSKIRDRDVFKRYSQTAYEKSIMRYKRLWADYIKMICEVVDYQFIRHRDYQPGMKCAIYCGMIEMNKALVEALQKKYPHLKTTLFVGGSDEEAMLKSDLIVTSLQMAGTGRDIPDLMVGICTLGLSAQQANEQLVGRLREPRRFAGVPVRFIFLYNKDNTKHQTYNAQRQKNLSGKLHSFNELISDLII